ncbi:MAG: hypothetical protein LBU76_05170 [Azoarcus sp.]|jgi:hypothetical protein|nr:hypothetical protein [Azoarcus sp.]
MKNKNRFIPRFIIGIIIIMSLTYCTAANWVPYPSDSDYGPEICYSPNHDYYIKRYQTVAESLTDQLYAEGKAELYSKSGKLLYTGKTFLSMEVGPYWDFKSVYFLGGYDWHVLLPTSTGVLLDRNRGCF